MRFRTLVFFLLSFTCLQAFSQVAPSASQTVLPSLAPMLKRVMPSIVNISVEGDLGPKGGSAHADGKHHATHRKFEALGSGVVIDAAKGYIVTNNHVVRQAKIITVTLSDGRRLDAHLVGGDKDSDIAVLKVKAKYLHALALGNSDRVQVGDFVVAIGDPFGLDQMGGNQTATFGLVSALQRDALNIEGMENFIQTDAAINPGNSGGALVDMQGRLIGINTALIGPNGANVGIGFAIPSNMMLNVMDQLIKYGSIHRGLLGVFVQRLTPELATALGYPKADGALVTQVNPDSPASHAKLRNGDIIRRVNGRAITSAAQVKNIVGLVRVGNKIHLQVLRAGRVMNMTVVITDIKKHEKDLIAKNPFLYGLALHNFEQESPWHGHVSGVQVLAVADSSPAWRAGLLPGDVIISVNQTAVPTLRTLQSLASSKKQSQLLLQVLRGAGSLFLVVKK